MKVENNLKLTTIEELREMGGGEQGELVELPGWGNGRPFVARLRRPSLLRMAIAGTIPNPLQGAISVLYATGKLKAEGKTSDGFKQVGEAILLIAEQTLAEPTMEEMKKGGIALTDEQLNFIYLYAQGGVAALAPFRAQQSVPTDGEDGEDVVQAAKRIASSIESVRGVLR